MNEFIVELAIRSLILAGLGLILRFALIRSSAQARAKILTLTMAALAILPVAMLVLPKMEVAVRKVEEATASSGIVFSNQVAAVAPVATPQWGWLWLVAAGLLAARVVLSLVRFHQVERSLAPASQSLSDRVRNLTSRARSVFVCPEGEPPMTWGMVRPKIALPQESEEWIEPQFRSVVLHEDAHIQRRDWAVSIGFRFVAALYWFNPLVWMLQIFFEQDSERAADDCVLAQGLNAPEYAERILEVARALRSDSGRLPVVTMARTGRLKSRLRAILSSKTPRGPILGWKRAMVVGPLVCGALAAGLVVPVTKRIPVARQEPTSNVTNRTVSKVETFEPPTTDSELNDLDVSPPSATPELPKTAAGHPVSTDIVAPPTGQKNPASCAVNSNPPGMSISDGSGHTISISNDGGDDPSADNEEANNDFEDAMSEVKKSLAEASRESKQALKEAQKEAQKQIEEAKKELEKNGIPEKDKKAAQASLDFAKGMADFSIKLAGDLANMEIDTKGLNINFDGKSKDKKEKKTEAKPSKSTPAKKSP